MNWKLIWKYTGLIIAATGLAGFLFGRIAGLYAEAPPPFGFVILTGLANVIIIVAAFAKLSLEQRERANLHALAILLLCTLIPLPFNVVMEQSLTEWVMSIIVLTATAAVGVGCGALLRPHQSKSAAEALRFVEIKDSGTRIKTDKIQICLSCGVKNRLSKAVLIGVKPVCGKCGGALQDFIYQPEVSEAFKYADAGSTVFQYENRKTNIYEPQPARAGETYASKQTAPNSPPVFVPYEEKASDELWNELFARLLRDREKAFRIVNSLKRKHPNRSERWCVEKAVEDLQRDCW